LNVEDYRVQLHGLVSQASKSLSAKELMAGLITNLASIIAINHYQTNTPACDLIDIVNHELDQTVVKCLLHYGASS
jgi:hypothetical protein